MNLYCARSCDLGANCCQTVAFSGNVLAFAIQCGRFSCRLPESRDMNVLLCECWCFRNNMMYCEVCAIVRVYVAPSAHQLQHAQSAAMGGRWGTYKGVAVWLLPLRGLHDSGSIFALLRR